MRSGREHWAWMIVVEVRQEEKRRRGEEKRRRRRGGEEEEEATDIKSNNPHLAGGEKRIKGPDNPTCQLLPIMGNKCCSGTGKAEKTKEVVEDRDVKQVVCEELCVTKLYVKDGV